MIHKDYVRRQLAKDQGNVKKESVVPWNDLPLILKESNYDQANKIVSMLEKYNYCVTLQKDFDADRFEFEENVS